MNTTKKLICSLIAGTALVAAAPVFADSYHDRGYEHNRHSVYARDYDRHAYRGYDRHAYRGYDRHYYDRRHFVVERPYVVQRPYIVEQPVYYSQPYSQPAQNYGIGAMIGAAIGGIYDSRQ